MNAQEIIDDMMAELDDLPAEQRYTESGKRIYHLDFTPDGERVLRSHIATLLEHEAAWRRKAIYLDAVLREVHDVIGDNAHPLPRAIVARIKVAIGKTE